MTELVERIQAERLKLARAIEGNPKSPTEEALADAVAFVLCQLEAAAHGVAGKSKPCEHLKRRSERGYDRCEDCMAMRPQTTNAPWQLPEPPDNPGDRTEGERHAHAKHHYSERGLCWYCSCSAWSADDGVSWTESTQPLDVANRRIAELEAQLGKATARAEHQAGLYSNESKISDRLGAQSLDQQQQIERLEAQLAERDKTHKEMAVQSALWEELAGAAEAERDSLRERLCLLEILGNELWCAVRDGELSCPLCDQRGGPDKNEHQDECELRKWLASLPAPEVAPEPAEPGGP